jgi:uncharacterized protein (DUF433 family)
MGIPNMPNTKPMDHSKILESAGGQVISDPEILAGTPVFKGTRVPARILFEYLADGLSLDYFLETFPTVEREQAVALLREGAHWIEQDLAA